jgi:valyl-tRNA synthetase
MDWNPEVKIRFNAFTAKIPVFHRHITEEAVTKRAEELAKARKSNLVQEEDVIAAFFSDVPSPFYSMMIRLLEQTGFDYKKYGYPKK